MPVEFKQKIWPHEMPEILWRFGYGEDWRTLDSWGMLTALQVGQAMHRARAHHCHICEELVLDRDGGHMVECGMPSHHFYGSQCELCIPDGMRALLELHETGLVDLNMSGTPTEKAKELRFEMETADLLDPGRDRKEEIPNGRLREADRVGLDPRLRPAETVYAGEEPVERERGGSER